MKANEGGWSFGLRKGTDLVVLISGGGLKKGAVGG